MEGLQMNCTCGRNKAACEAKRERHDLLVALRPFGIAWVQYGQSTIVKLAAP
jgi:hypothetical protein